MQLSLPRLSLPHSAGWLDQRLAAGASPQESRALRRRARRLMSGRKRRSLAASVYRVLAEAEQPARPFSSAVPTQRRAVHSCRPLLVQVAQDLDDTELPVSAKGVALVEQLLTDGGSPVYAPVGERALEEAVRRAHAALLMG
jgi:hypothetical protein